MMQKEFWDERYGGEGYAYGEEPNVFLAGKLQSLTPGSILFPLEGEGRNAVYAAKLGWKVSAFDQSVEGRKKALLLAKRNAVHIEYRTGDFEAMQYMPGQFDAIALIFAHFPEAERAAYHQRITGWLRVGGVLLLEAFSCDHAALRDANPAAGGPRDIGMLYTAAGVLSDFPGYDALELYETVEELHEGRFHTGRSALVRFVGRKGEG